jgi:hypothetical protein
MHRQGIGDPDESNGRNGKAQGGIDPPHGGEIILAALPKGGMGNSFPNLPKNRAKNRTAHKERRDSAERFNWIDDGHVRTGDQSTGAEHR